MGRGDQWLFGEDAASSRHEIVGCSPIAQQVSNRRTRYRRKSTTSMAGWSTPSGVHLRSPYWSGFSRCGTFDPTPAAKAGLLVLRIQCTAKAVLHPCGSRCCGRKRGAVKNEWRTTAEEGPDYSSLLPSIAFCMVTSSAYSMSLPTGTPVAMRVTFTPEARNNCDR